MQTIGERLEEARKRKGISLREAAEATKIRGDYLHKFESNQYDLKLPEIYVRGFLRTYANFLKLPADKIASEYDALGRAAARAPRMPNREIYGRMDLSVASGTSTAEAEPPPAAPAGEEPAPESPPPPRRMPQPFRNKMPGPGVPLDVVLKIAFSIAAIVAAVLLAVWGIKAAFSGAKKPTVTTGEIIAAQPAMERTISLVALDTVNVTVALKNPDGTSGNILFQGVLTRGQTQTVPWPGPIYISASAGQNLQIGYNGKLYSCQFTGIGRAQMGEPK